MRTIITGATGLIGGKLLAGLEREDVTVLTRDVAAARRSIDAGRFVAWDGISDIAAEVFERAEVVYHLAGEPVASGRWSADKKQRILESRTLGTRAVVEAMARAGSKPVLVSASAVGYYGSRDEEVLTEASAPGSGFLPDVCKAWEAAAESAARSGSRVAMLRIGIVLAREGGALAKMLPIFRTGLAGRLGSGEQWMPWIHVDDVVSLFRHAAAAREVEGPINAVSPNPVTNADFTAALARAIHRPAVLPAPKLALRAVLGEMAEVVLASQRVIPERALRHGHVFRHPRLPEALAALFAPAPSSSSSSHRDAAAVSAAPLQ